nr:iridoid synthase-like [Ipomoea trifida]
MGQENCSKAVALVVGATGMVGVATVEALKQPTALGGPWKVYGAARRPLPSWFPSSFLDEYITFDALNLEDTHKSLSKISNEVTHVFWLALQVHEKEEENIRLNSTMLDNVLRSLTSSNSTSLTHVTIQTGTKQYMGPIFDPSLATDKMIPHEAPFKEDYPRLPFPNFYYALEDLVANYAETNSFSFSIHRSSIIIGASSLSVFNSLLTLCVYAIICKEKGFPFRYPGNRNTWHHFCDMSDARLLAEQQIWAGVTEKAKNQAFNCTNGDVFAWKSIWRLFCDMFELEFVAFEENDDKQFDIVEFMKDKGEIWEGIVQKDGLFRTRMEEITCYPALQTVLRFPFQHVCSMNKSKEFGFLGYADTLKRMRVWVQKLREMKIIP